MTAVGTIGTTPAVVGNPTPPAPRMRPCPHPKSPPATSVIDPPILPPQFVYIYRSTPGSSIGLTVAARQTYTFSGGGSHAGANAGEDSRAGLREPQDRDGSLRPPRAHSPAPCPHPAAGGKPGHRGDRGPGAGILRPLRADRTAPAPEWRRRDPGETGK